jgi:chorismate--pyruvate lyase
MKEISWQSYPVLPELPASPLSGWLLHVGSFMQRLKGLGVNAKVKVLNEGWQFLPPDERELLKIPSRIYARVREVLISSQKGRWMYARTVIPAKTLTGKERQLANLKNRSLGSVLFSNPATQRSPFEFACLSPQIKGYTKISEHLATTHSIWARRSQFHIQDKTLLLAEFFSPAIADLLHAN